MGNRRRELARRRLDERLAQFSTIPQATPARGWIRAIRDALGMTGAQLAARMHSTRQVIAKIENSEAKGTIQISTLRKMAEALDCTLVYALVPRRPLEDSVTDRKRALAVRELTRIDRTMALENQTVGREAREERIADYISQHVRDSDIWNER